MADIRLSRPAANQTQTVTSAADARFVLNFPASEAKLAKSDNGENLVLTFDDGAKIEVEGFYTAFTKDNLPTLNVGGQDITGDQLAAVLGEDLMPAAGPSAGQAAAQGGRFRSFADSDLNGGLDRLGGLDIGFDGAAQQDDTPEGYYTPADAPTTGGEEAAPESFEEVVPEHSLSLDIAVDALQVFESGLASGSRPGMTPTTASGSLRIALPGGLDAVQIAGVTVIHGGHLTDTLSITTPEGVFTVTGYDAATGTLQYAFVLQAATAHAAGDTSLACSLAVVARNAAGDSAHGAIPVSIVDDAPAFTGGRLVSMRGGWYGDVAGTEGSAGAHGDTDAVNVAQLRGLGAALWSKLWGNAAAAPGGTPASADPDVGDTSAGAPDPSSTSAGGTGVGGVVAGASGTDAVNVAQLGGGTVHDGNVDFAPGADGAVLTFNIVAMQNAMQRPRRRGAKPHTGCLPDCPWGEHHRGL